MGAKPKAKAKEAPKEEPQPEEQVEEVPKKKIDVAKVHAALERLNKNNATLIHAQEELKETQKLAHWKDKRRQQELARLQKQMNDVTEVHPDTKLEAVKSTMDAALLRMSELRLMAEYQVKELEKKCEDKDTLIEQLQMQLRDAHDEIARFKGGGGVVAVKNVTSQNESLGVPKTKSPVVKQNSSKQLTLANSNDQSPKSSGKNKQIGRGETYLNDTINQRAGTQNES